MSNCKLENLFKEIGLKNKYDHVAGSMANIILLNEFEFVEGGINDRYRIKPGIVLKRFCKINEIKESEFVREFWFYSLAEARNIIRTLSFFIFESMYTLVVTQLNKLFNLKSEKLDFEFELILIQPPTQIESHSNPLLTLLTNTCVESIHMYAWNTYYSLLNKLKTQNLTFNFGDTNGVPISQTLIELMLGEEGLLNIVETSSNLPEFSKHLLWDLDSQKSK